MLIQLSLWDYVQKKLSPRPHRCRVNIKKSDPFLFQIWARLQSNYFPEHATLNEYLVIWSHKSQKRVLASCNIRKRVVRVARELSGDSCSEWLEPLLYHEMCHAVLDPQQLKSKGRIRWHGREFRSLERRHPNIKELDRWIDRGGWRTLVRSDRAKRSAHQRRTQCEELTDSSRR